MASPLTGIHTLPNELLLTTLTPLPTRTLLPLTLISHRFYSLITRILHTRLLSISPLPSHTLVLECFHPSNKILTPYLFCDYLGTDTLQSSPDETKSFESGMSSSESDIGELGKLGKLYSHFRPKMPEDEERPKRRTPHPAGDVPGHPNTSTYFPGPSASASADQNSQQAARDDELVEIEVNLEAHELFSQLRTITNLVKVGPKRGLFLSCVDVGDGVIRVFREWAERVAEDVDNGSGEEGPVLVTAEEIECEDGKGKGKSGEKGKDEERDDRDERLRWVGNDESVGIRFRVERKREARMSAAVVLGRMEDVPVSYTLKYEELLVRTADILLKVEESALRENEDTGKATVIGFFNEA